MGSGIKTVTTTKHKAIKKHRKEFDKLSTRDAQVLRMLHAVDEPNDSKVGAPPEGTPEDLKQRLLDVEAEIFERIRSAVQAQSPKGNIVQKLKDDS